MDAKNLQRFNFGLRIPHGQPAYLQSQQLSFQSTQNLKLELRDPRFLESDDVEKDGTKESELGGIGDQPLKRIEEDH
ncbi:hypothetical protein WAI453_004790 [Rhynchosporium graminicola]